MNKNKRIICIFISLLFHLLLILLFCMDKDSLQNKRINTNNISAFNIIEIEKEKNYNKLINKGKNHNNKSKDKNKIVIDKAVNLIKFSHNDFLNMNIFQGKRKSDSLAIDKIDSITTSLLNKNIISKYKFQSEDNTDVFSVYIEINEFGRVLKCSIFDKAKKRNENINDINSRICINFYSVTFHSLNLEKKGFIDITWIRNEFIFLRSGELIIPFDKNGVEFSPKDISKKVFEFKNRE